MPAKFRNITSFMILFSIFLSPPASAEKAFEYQSEDGLFWIPPGTPVHSKSNPGDEAKEIERHSPKLEISHRDDGLQDILLLKIKFDHPMIPEVENLEEKPEDKKADENGRIKEIYIVDKDRVIIGYRSFPNLVTDASTKIRINGNINYFDIYVICSKHGVWKKTFASL